MVILGLIHKVPLLWGSYGSTGLANQMSWRFNYHFDIKTIVYKLRCCEFKGKQAPKIESTSLCCISYTVLHVRDQKNEWSVFVD